MQIYEMYEKPINMRLSSVEPKPNRMVSTHNFFYIEFEKQKKTFRVVIARQTVESVTKQAKKKEAKFD